MKSFTIGMVTVFIQKTNSNPPQGAVRLFFQVSHFERIIGMWNFFKPKPKPSPLASLKEDIDRISEKMNQLLGLLRDERFPCIIFDGVEFNCRHVLVTNPEHSTNKVWIVVPIHTLKYLEANRELGNKEAKMILENYVWGLPKNDFENLTEDEIANQIKAFHLGR